jgi:hypothetical protein
VSEFLSPAEVKDLAGCVARDAQAEKLAALGVPFRRDGSRLIVSRDIARRWTCGESFRMSSGVNWGAVR